MHKPIAVFALQDHLAHRWTNELVGFEVTNLPASQPVAIRDDAGRLLPCQVSDGRVHFVVDELPPLARKEFTLVTANVPAQPPAARTANEIVELDNRLIAVKIPASRRSAELPAPILAVRRGNEAWVGEGRVFFSPTLQPLALESRELEAGPLWRRWQLDYQFAGGERYRVTLKLFADRPCVEVTEESSLCRESRWEFSVRERLQPTHTWTHPHMLNPDSPQRLAAIDFADRSRNGNLGSIQMPNYSGIWVPDDYYYFAFLNERDAVAAVGVNGGFWDYPYENQIDCEVTPERDAFFRLSIKAGHRRWLLHVAERRDVVETKPFYQNPIHQAAKRYETPLDKVKEYVLAWDDAPAAQRPFAIANRDQLADTQRKARAYGKFQEYVASLNPDLPGDYTYYHSGTHRTFTPDRRNDPAVLYVTATTDAERKKQAAFLKDVVLTGLQHRREAMLDKTGHLDVDGSASINVGRGLRPWAALYDLAAAECVFSPSEERLARATFAFYGYKINDPDYWPADALTFRDDHPRSAHRTHWFPKRQHDWSFYNIDNIPHNFHGDLWSAAGCIALTFPTHPESRRWVERTLEFWEAELTYWVFPDGPWLESSTYTLNSMKDYLIYCRMLANARIRDYFTDERLQRAFRCVAEHLGPHDKQIGGTSLPVMGDGSYPNGFCYVLGWMGGLAAHDLKFAALMNQAWKTTGEYLTEPGRFGLNFCDFLFIDPNGPTRPLPALESKWYRGLGAILRHAHRTPEEIYLFIKAGIIYSHFHEPEGTFQLWWHSVPVCDEYGVQYGKGDDGRFVWDAGCHNCIAVAGQPLSYNKGDFTTFLTTDAFDHAVVEAPVQLAYLRPNEIIWGFRGEVGPAGWHKRHFLFVKPHYLFIYDDLECPHPTKYHLNVKANGHKQTGNHVHYDGRLGVDLEFLALDLGDRHIQHGEYNVRPPATQAFQPPPKFYHQLQLTIAGQPHEHYATLLVPHKPTEPVTVANDPGTGGARITRGTATERAMLFPQRREIRDGNLIYTGQAGAIREQDGSLTLLQASGTRIGLADRLVINGDGPFTATLQPDNQLFLETRGVARWLRIEMAGGQAREVCVPYGNQRVKVR